MSSLTNRSVKFLRDEGYLVDVVEKWIPKINIRKDLFGMFDLLAIKGKETMAVQVTSTDHISHRRNKMHESVNYPRVLDAGWTIEIHGWVKKGNRWKVTREVMT